MRNPTKSVIVIFSFMYFHFNSRSQRDLGHRPRVNTHSFRDRGASYLNFVRKGSFRKMEIRVPSFQCSREDENKKNKSKGLAKCLM